MGNAQVRDNLNALSDVECRISHALALRDQLRRLGWKRHMVADDD